MSRMVKLVYKENWLSKVTQICVLRLQLEWLTDQIKNIHFMGYKMGMLARYA